MKQTVDVTCDEEKQEVEDDIELLVRMMIRISIGDD
jgi:hypothetical protein